MSDGPASWVELDVPGQPQRLELAWHGRERSGPTLVFLHEGLGSVSQWRDFPAALAERCDLPALVYSRAGYGRSTPVSVPRPLTYMHHEAQVVLPMLLDALALEEVVLVGHSDGASIALMHAATAHGRGRVRALVLEAPHVFCEPRSVAAIRLARDRFERSGDDRQGGLRAGLARHHEDVEGAFWGWNRAWLDPDFERWNIEAALPDITAPSLVIQSDEDPYGTLAQVRAIATQSGGDVDRLILSNCGHAPHRDRRPETLAAMAAFISAKAL